MLTSDFGDSIDVQTDDSTMVQEGELMVGIRNAIWVARIGDRVVSDSAKVDDEVFSTELALCPIGATLVSIAGAKDQRFITLQFDNAFTLSLDSSNTWKTESDLFEITFPDGRIVVLDKDGSLDFLEETESIRAKRWRTRLH
jgi:hypothetical protein